MYGLVILGCSTAYALHELWRHISNSSHDQFLVTEDNNTTASGRNSRSNNKDSINQSDRTPIYYYESYPNLGTTKIPGTVSPQSEYGNKSTEGTNESFARFSNSRTSPPSFSNNPSPSSPKLPQSKPSSFAKPASASSTSFQSATEPPPSPSSTSSSFSKPAIPSSKPASPLPKCAPSSINKSSFSKEPPSFTSDQPQSSTRPPASSSVPIPSSPKALPSSKPTLSPLHSDSTNQQGFAKPALASSTSFLSATEPPPSSSSTSSSNTSSSFSKPAIPSSKPASALPKYAPSSFNQSSFSHEPPSFTSDQPRSSIKPSTSPFVPTPSSPEALPSYKPTLFPFHSDSTNQQGKANYMRVENGTSPIYMIPKDIENMFKKGIVPDVLKKPLSPSTYKDYFAALLYAEDFYIEKWSNIQLNSVTLVLHEPAIDDKSLKNKNLKGSDEKDDKIFMAFEIDSVPERWPFLLPRDFVYARRAGFTAKEFQGIIYRVVKSSTVLVEFGKDFYSQHRADCEYDISFSFNKVCLERAHQAIAVASDPLYQDYLFPDCASRKNTPSSAPCLYSNSADCQGQLPYLIEGPLCVIGDKLSKTGLVIQEVVFKIYRKASKSRMLICAPINGTCDVLLGSLKKVIPELDIFGANAAFREMDGVAGHIPPSCPCEGECFSCPSLQELRQFRVIFSTFASSFHLHNKGITAGHFSHIFLLDASSATEPEALVALNNLANENTTVMVTGAPNDRPRWVRSDIARRNGLSKSYFKRLRATKTYSNSNPKFFKQL